MIDRYQSFRLFGYLPDPSEEFWALGPANAFKGELGLLEANPTEAGRVEIFSSIALSFSRYDILGEVDPLLDKDDGAESCLARGRLRFYRALAQSPTDPDESVLKEASSFFRLARRRGKGRIRHEALAALARIDAVQGRHPRAYGSLLRLILNPRAAAKTAAAGLLLFFADGFGATLLSGDVARAMAERFLRRESQLREAACFAATLTFDRGQYKQGTKKLWALLSQGRIEAALILARLAMETFSHENLDLPEAPEELKKHGVSVTRISGIANLLTYYQSHRPSDPRGLVTMGDLQYAANVEEAQIKWRAALVADDRSWEAWLRLGDMYREAAERLEGEEDQQDQWIAAARDAYQKAASLSPLDPYPRTALGMLEREAGQPEVAIAALEGAFALRNDDPMVLRWLAASWTYFIETRSLDGLKGRSAAERARSLWMKLHRADPESTFDASGALRALCLEASFIEEGLEYQQNDVEALIGVLLNGTEPPDTEDWIDLAGHLADAGLPDHGVLLIQRLLKSSPDDVTLLRHQAVLTGDSRVFLEAVETMDLQRDDAVDNLAVAARFYEAFGNRDKAAELWSRAKDSRPSDSGVLRSAADNAHRAGRSDEALSLYHHAVRRFPDQPDLPEDGAWFARSIGRDADAEALLRWSLDHNPDSGRLWNQLGVHFMEVSGHHEEGSAEEKEAVMRSIEAYRKAAELHPEERIFQGNLADALRQAHRWDEAEAILLSLTEEGRGDAFSLNVLARLEDQRSYMFEGSDGSIVDWQAAGDHYRRACEAESADADHFKDYAWWLYRERRHAEAIESYTQAEALDASDPTIPYGLSVCYKELGNEHQALQALERALALVPDEPNYLADKADLLGELGRIDDAGDLFLTLSQERSDQVWIWERWADFAEKRIQDGNDPRRWQRETLRLREKASQAAPEDAEVLARAGEAWRLVGRRDKARSYFEKALKKRPNMGFALNRLGRLEDTEGHHQAASKQYAAATEAAPGEADYHADLARSLSQDQDWTGALAAAREARRRRPDQPAFSALVGTAAYRKGLFEESAAMLAAALEQSPGNAEWLNLLGLSLLALGRTQRALDAFRDASLEDPDNEEYLANLAMAHESLHHPAQDGFLQ